MGLKQRHKFAKFSLSHWENTVLKRLFFLFFLLLALPACNLSTDWLERPPTQPTLSAPTDAPWQRTADGIEWRLLKPAADELAQMLVARIDPRQFRFRALYRPGAPLSLNAWREQAPSASLIINANFFDANETALGLIISDGSVYGQAYQERGGSFIVRKGRPTVIANRGAALSLAGIEQAVQGFPLLVEYGAPAYFGASGQRKRRTVIAEDRAGNILIIVAPYLGLSLADLSAYLAESELGITQAVNLDGGGSTMIALPGANYFQPSLDAVPAILAIYAG